MSCFSFCICILNFLLSFLFYPMYLTASIPDLMFQYGSQCMHFSGKFCLIFGSLLENYLFYKNHHRHTPQPNPVQSNPQRSSILITYVIFYPYSYQCISFFFLCLSLDSYRFLPFITSALAVLTSKVASLGHTFRA